MPELRPKAPVARLRSLAAAPPALAAPALALLALALALALPGAAQAQGGNEPTAAAPVVIDGPSPAITAPTGLGLAVARDGSGGLVYLKGGHVFVSALAGGTFLTPVEIDAALPGPSSQPVIAAANGGEVAVAFVNGGNLYVTERASAATGLEPIRLLAYASINPALQMTTFGKAYLAFTAAAGGGENVRAAYYDAGTWAFESTPLNVVPNDDAGTGTGRPAVAAANDGVAIVAWGEGGHVFTRRVWGTAASVVEEQADAPLPGCTELAADEPAIGSGGDSSYAAVAFHETLSCAGQTESRVLVNRLQAGIFDGVQPADALGTPAIEGADDPAVAVSEYGHGWVTSERTSSGMAIGYTLANNEGYGTGAQINQLPDASAPATTPAIAGYYSSLIAWQHDPGTGAFPEIRMRFSDASGDLGPETVLSNPAQGPTDAAAGLAAAGNVDGEAAVAWVQSAPAGNEIVVDQLYQPPGPPQITSSFSYARTTFPRLTWAASTEPWGPVRYAVSVDGASIGETTALSAVPTAALGQGPHTFSVTALNPAGLSSGPRSATVFVDTIPPAVRLVLSGHRIAGEVLRLHVIATDAPPPLPARDASGVLRVTVHWGDHTIRNIAHWSLHAYARPGRYHLTVVVFDRAGNETVVHLLVVIHAAKAKAAPAPGKKS